MRAVLRKRFLPTLLAAFLAWHGEARAACSVQERAAVPFALADGHLLVPLAVNGASASFILDTGAERSLVTPQAVHRLNLALDKWVDTTMQGVGGITEHANADPRSLTLGGIALQRHTITHDTSLTVGDFPAMAADATIDGLLGRDFLSPFDLQLDMATHRLTLYDVRGCSGRFLPWKQPYDAVRTIAPMGRAMVVTILLDGRPLSALLDTGASASMLTLPGMIRMGLTPALLVHDRADTVRGVGTHARVMRRHRFGTLQVGEERIRDPLLWVSSVRVLPIVDALLGADWLAMQSRVWISFATSQAFFVPR